MILGLDTSRWEDDARTPKTIDWNKVKAAGAEFVIMKATEGTTYVDPVFQLHKANSAGILYRGSYHFWRCKQPAAAQAAHYFKTAGNLDMPPVLDVEDWYKELPIGKPLEAKVLEMLTEIDKAFGRECILYTSPNIIRYYLQLMPGSPLLNRKLWIANYNVAEPYIAPFKRWSLWQFSERGQAAKYGIDEAMAVDENWYNGTLEDFKREMITGETVPPKQTAGLYRIKDDLEAGIAPNGTRPFLRIGLPSTVRLRGGRGFAMLPARWMSYIAKINTSRAYDYIFKPASGWHNTGNINRVEQLTFSGNIVEVTRIEDNRAYIKTVDISTEPPANAVQPTPSNLHTLIHLFTTQYKDHLDMTTDGRLPRIILAANAGEELWINTGDIAPYKPTYVTAKVTALPWLNVRIAPSTTAMIATRKLPGASVTIYETLAMGADLWGRIDGGWICLRKGAAWYTTYRP